MEFFLQQQQRNSSNMHSEGQERVLPCMLASLQDCDQLCKGRCDSACGCLKLKLELGMLLPRKKVGSKQVMITRHRNWQLQHRTNADHMHVVGQQP